MTPPQKKITGLTSHLVDPDCVEELEYVKAVIGEYPITG